jgi:hypothetical protein
MTDVTATTDWASAGPLSHDAGSARYRTHMARDVSSGRYRTAEFVTP